MRTHLALSYLVTLLVLTSISQGLFAVPLAPTSLRVSDTQNWPGIAGGPEPVQGLSKHVWFTATHHGGPSSPAAVAVRVQVGLDPEFNEVVWDSGFVSIAPTAPGSEMPPVAVNADTLVFGQGYYWRAAVKDTTNAASAYSLILGHFVVVGTPSSADLRVQYTTAVAPVQGHPAVTATATVGFTAELCGEPGTQALVQQVEIALDADFGEVVWTSNEVATGGTQEGQRAAPILPGAEWAPEPGVTYFWRHRYGGGGGAMFDWSLAPASFVYILPDATAPAPAGFNRAVQAFGDPSGAKDFVLGDFNGDGVQDALLLSNTIGASHQVVLSYGTTAPQIIPFGASLPGNAFVATADCNFDQLPDALIADSSGISLWVNDGTGALTLAGFVQGYSDNPTGLAIGEINLDGVPEAVVAYDNVVRIYDLYSDEISAPLYELQVEGLCRSLVILPANDNDFARVLVLSELLSSVSSHKGEYWESGYWDMAGVQAIVRAQVNSTFSDRRVFFVTEDTLTLQRLRGENWHQIAQCTLPYPGGTVDIAGADLDGNGHPDAVVVKGSMAYVMMGNGAAFEATEHLGHAQEYEIRRARIGQADQDGRWDILLASTAFPVRVFPNRLRIGASILSTVAYQPELGEAWVEFEVVLDAPPVGVVEVWCETVLEPEGGDGDGDALPDVSEFMRGQMGGGYIPTSSRLVFGPGQMQAKFRVRLAAPLGTASWTLTARIYRAVGAAHAISAATALVYPAGTGSSGPASAPGQQRDWRIDGEVRAVTRVGDHVYFGGEFSSVSWDAGGVATLDAEGRRRLALGQINGTVFATLMDSDGSIFVGGQFDLNVQGQLIKNAAKLTANGQWDLQWRPNPDGPVYALAVSDWGQIYLGGAFEQLDNVAGCFNNIAVLPKHTHISTGQSADRFKVWQSTHAGARTGGTVYALKWIAETASSSSVVVGGSQLAKWHGPTHGGDFVIGNFTGFKTSGNHYWQLPRAAGAVYALEVTGTTFGTSTLPAIVLAGQFQSVTYAPFSASDTASTAYVATTNLLGQRDPTNNYSSPTAVRALLVTGGNKLWIGRGAAASSGAIDPLALCNIAGGKLTPVTTFASGLNQVVTGLAAADDRVLAVGLFTSAAGTPVGHMAAYSLGAPHARVGEFATMVNGNLNSVSAGRSSTGAFLGFVVGGGFTSLATSRGNVAAMHKNGELVAWGPSFNGPVHAMATDGSRIFVGGSFTQAMGTQTLNRGGLASVSQAVGTLDADGWSVNVAGASATVNALELQAGSLLVGGDFTTIGGVARIDVASVSTSISGSGSVLSSWDANLVDAAGEAVYALSRDGTNTWLGGNFNHVNVGGTPTLRPALIAVTSPGAGSGSLVSGWNAQLAQGSLVRAIARSNSNVYLGGELTTVGGQPRADLASVALADGAVDAFAPAVDGVYALAGSVTGPIYVGGSFQTAQGAPRAGVAAFDISGNLQSWDASVLSASGAERVRVLLMDDTYSSTPVIWVGGSHTGMQHSGQHKLTHFSRAWYITTQNLPAAHEDQPYGPVAVQLSESIACIWTLQSPAAPQLVIDPNTGVVSGFVQLGAPAQIPVLVTATQTAPPYQAASKWFVISLIPVPPPTTVSVFGPSVVAEGNQPIRTVLWTAELNQPFSQDVQIQVELVAGSARAGVDYALVDEFVTIPHGQATATFRVGIFGDTLPEQQTKNFTIRLHSLTQNVAPHIHQGQFQVSITDDDPSQPAAAYVRAARVQETESELGHSERIVASQPWFVWDFGTDIPGTTQMCWQVQVTLDSTFLTNPIWDSGQVASTDDTVQCAVNLNNGQNYYVRVRLWPSTGSVSEWHVFAFRTNTPPPLPTGPLTPTGTTTKITPTFEWGVTPDADGDSQHFEVVLLYVPTGNSVTFDSEPHNQRFQQFVSGAWVPLPHGGSDPLATRVRGVLPSSLALLAGDWTWTVRARDGFETGLASPITPLLVNPSVRIEGHVLDIGGVAEPGRTIKLASLPGYTVLAQGVSGPQGEFSIVYNGALQEGQAVVIFADTGVAQYPAACYLRFPGGDLTAASGEFARVTLTHLQVTTDSRGRAPLTLADLESSSDAGLPFELAAAGLELKQSFNEFRVFGRLHLLAAGLAAGQPPVLTLAGAPQGQPLEVGQDSTLIVGAGVTLQAWRIDSVGDIGVDGTLRVSQHSTSGGILGLNQGSRLELQGVNWTLTTGQLQALEATIVGNGLPTGLIVGDATAEIIGCDFESVSLQLGTGATVLSLRDCNFTGPLPTMPAVYWAVQASQNTVAEGLTFDGMAVVSVEASATASTLELHGCGGAGAGEAFDLDPAEPTGDLVVWIAAAVEDLVGICGHEKVLLLWNGTQSGTNTAFEVFASASELGPFQSMGTTADSYFVVTNLVNDVLCYFYVQTVSAGIPGPESVRIAVVPKETTLVTADFGVVEETGVAPCSVVGSGTNFDVSTTITANHAGLSIPQASVLALSPNLVLFDIETISAAPAVIVVEIFTAEIWTEHGVSGHSEQLFASVEVAPPPSPNSPIVEYVETGGSAGPDELTDGPFTVTVEFDANGSSDIDPASFECIVDRDIYVAGQLVEAGTDLAAVPYVLWGNVGTTGATWIVDQILATTDPDEEFITKGELIIRTRVANGYGVRSEWTDLRIFVQGADSDVAFVNAELRQGVSQQTVLITGNALGEADTVVFPNEPEITIHNVIVNQDPGAGYPAKLYYDEDGKVVLPTIADTLSIEVLLSVGENAKIGRGVFEVRKQSTSHVYATGSYTIIPDYTYTGAPNSYPDPMATVAAHNVTLQNGEFTLTTTDISTKSGVFPIVWDRTYRSSKSEELRPNGRGWFNTYTQEVHFDFSSGGDFKWVTPRGDYVKFLSIVQGGTLTGFVTPTGVDAEAVVAEFASGSTTIPRRLQIQVSGGIAYSFGPSREISDNPLVWSYRLDSVSDSHRNTHEVVYNSSEQIVQVNTDECIERGHGEALRFYYHDNGRIKMIRREVRSATGGNMYDYYEAVGYWYTENSRLTLQRLPSGHRFPVTLYNGYAYEQFLNGGWPLTHVYPPSQVVPTTLNGHQGAVSVATSPVPSLINGYQLLSGERRVVQQATPSATGSGSSWRTVSIAYVEPPQWASPKRIISWPDLTTEEFWLNGSGQATYHARSSGAGMDETQYAYHPSTRALIKVVHPNGSSSHFLHQAGESVLTGTFTAGSELYRKAGFIPLVYSKVTCSGLDDLDVWVEHMALLENEATGQKRYFVIEPGAFQNSNGTWATPVTTSGVYAYLFGNLADMGLGSGKITVFYGNESPLARYRVVQERHSRNSDLGLDDLITTRHSTYSRHLNLFYVSRTDTTGPHGEVSASVSMPEGGVAPVEFQHRPCHSWTLSRFKDADDNDRVVSGMTITDTRGRPTWTLSPATRFNEKASGEVTTRYLYFDDVWSDPEMAIRRLKSVTTTPSGQWAQPDHFAGSSTISYDIDSRGYPSTTKSPRAQSPLPYDEVNFTTTTYWNDAGQLYRVVAPGSGASSNSTTSPQVESWFWYDKDGRKEYEVQSYCPAGLTVPDPTGTDPQNELNLNNLATRFPRPASRTGAGWLHTKYVYDQRTGELLETTTDVDIGLVTAVTSQTYDIMGRVISTKTEKDAGEMFETTYTYDYRGLVLTETVAPGKSVEGKTEYTYDVSGNLVKVKTPGGKVFETFYDEFGRQIGSMAPCAGGELASFTNYSAPGKPLIIDQLAMGPGALPRSSRTFYDELGRVFRQDTLAENAAGQPLERASIIGGQGWARHEELMDATGSMNSRAYVTDERVTSSQDTCLILQQDARGPGGIVTTARRGVSTGGPSSTEVADLASFWYDAEMNVHKQEVSYLQWTADATVVKGESTSVIDPAGNVVEETGPHGLKVTITRNNLGWPTSVLDSQGRETRTEYNFAGQPTEVIVMDGSTSFTSTRMEYSRGGLLKKEIATRSGGTLNTTNLETLYTYDDRGRQTSVHRPGIGLWTYTYDADDQLTAETQPDGTVINNSYDSAGNLVTKFITNGEMMGQGMGTLPGNALLAKETYKYNAFGECTRAETFKLSGIAVIPESRLDMTYNSLGLIESQKLTVYDQSGAAIQVPFQSHLYDESVLGFKSRYYVAVGSHSYSSWEMKRQYDCLGREVLTSFWDGRHITTEYDGLDPVKVWDSCLPGNKTALISYQWKQALLEQRQFFSSAIDTIRHLVSPRPAQPHPAAISVTPGEGCSVSRFSTNERGELESVTHLHRRSGSSAWEVFAGVEVAYDRSGNPIVERRLDHGGLSRVMTYDRAGRMSASARGHLLSLGTGQLLGNPDYGTSGGYVAVPFAGVSQFVRSYSQDTVDNILGYTDSAAGTSGDTVTLALANTEANVYESITSTNSGSPGQYAYDAMGRITFDPSTGLEYSHNYRGQIHETKSGGNIVRRNIYDAFGRMVHQIENPGQTTMRGTILIPNIGFGGGGEGADYAAEVSYIVDGPVQGIEVVQFTNGIGAEAGGLGDKRVVELVAYGWELCTPHYRFLHEDALGSTIAVTSLWGDRLDEYQYTDYGAPIHTPVALDGRWITGISQDTVSGVAVARVSLSKDNMLSPNELIGTELRLVRRNPANAEDVFVAGTVMSHHLGSVTVLDPGHALANAWADSEKVLAAFYEMREGSIRGAVDSAFTTTYSGHGWSFVDATVIVVDQGPFDRDWMHTWQGTQPLKVKLGPDSQGDYQDFTVLDCDNNLSGARDRHLIVKGFDAAAYATGYQIDGAHKRQHMARAGEWAVNAAVSSPPISSTSTVGFTSTKFDLRPPTESGVGVDVALTLNLVGWVLQPDINKQVFAPITAVDAVNCSVTVGVDLASLAGVGKRWRIHAPPGSVTFGPGGGNSADFGTARVYVSANSTRHLFAGYRYESPLVGARELLTPIGSIAATGRQSGKNFTGQYYTLWRHYDPALMRFTGPDPAAQFHYNLFGYSKNAPGRYTDPDGDIIFLLPAIATFALVGGAIGGGADAAVQYSEHQDKVEAGTAQGSFTENYDVGRGLKWTGVGAATGVVTFHAVVGGMFAWQIAPAAANVALQSQIYGTAGGGGFFAALGARLFYGNSQAATNGAQRTQQTANVVSRVSSTAASSSNSGTGVWTVTTPVRTTVNPRLTQRLAAWRAYKAGDGTKNMAQWVKSTQGAPWGSGFRSGYAAWSKSVNSLHGNAALSDRPTTLYKLFHKDGTFLKWGVTGDTSTRYTKEFMENKSMIEFARGTRAEMLRMERQMVRTAPGPMNHEPWAGK